MLFNFVNGVGLLHGFWIDIKILIVKVSTRIAYPGKGMTSDAWEQVSNSAEEIIVVSKK